MSVYPEELLSMVSDAAAENPDSIDTAVDQVFEAWRANPDYSEHVDTLVRGMIRDLISNARHQVNVAHRRAAGMYGQAAKVGSSAANLIAMKCLLDTYSIGNKSLGSIMGSELVGIGQAEQERANGHAFNARLCERLSAIVNKDKSVRECVSEERIKRIFEELRGQRKVSAASMPPKSKTSMPHGGSGPGAIAARKKHTAASPA